MTDPVFVWDVSPVWFTLGPVQVHYYSILFVLTFLGGLQLWRWQMLRGGYGDAQAEVFFWYGVIAVVVGARLGHVFFYEWDIYSKDPIRILYVWKGGLASHGATVGLIVALWLYAHRHKIPLFEVFDRFSFSAALGSFMVRIGNFFNSEVVGRVSDVSWCMKFPLSVEDRGLPAALVPCRHPSQLYEVVMGLAVLCVLLLVDRRFGEKRLTGLLASLFMILYFSGRFCVEYAKEYQGLDPATHALTEGQYLSIPFILVGFGMLAWTLRHQQRPVAPTTTPVIDKARKKKGGRRRQR